MVLEGSFCSALREGVSTVLTQARAKYRGVLTVAQNLYRQDPDWVTFFREVMGIEGVIRKAFTTPEEMAEFEASDEYDEIQKLLAKLRERRGTPEKQTEPTRVITVRIPKSMHESLIKEADTKGTSMNKLCISKLLQVIDEEFIPTPPPSTRSRRKKKAVSAERSSGDSPARNGAPERSHVVDQREEAAEDL
jgi:predicted HicB family RNase H-like nuclease